MDHETTAAITNQTKDTFARVHNIVFEAYHLTAFELALYLALVYYANKNEDDKAWPSQTTLAKTAGMDKRSVIRTLPSLVEKRLITVESSVRGNTYTILDAVSNAPSSDTESPGSDTESPQEASAEVTESHRAVTESHHSSSDRESPQQPATREEVTQSHRVVTESHTTNVVVDSESESESDSKSQQQQRDPTPAEREAFRGLLLGEPVWRGWMDHPPEYVLACVLHAGGEPNVTNPVGLLRAMLEQGNGAPSKRYMEQAVRVLAGNPEPDSHDGSYYLESEFAWAIEH
jgi:hypothetical protein